MTQDQITVEIIQADRDAAASVHISSLHGEAIREGAMDANHVVQAFAKHRLSHSSTPSEVERPYLVWSNEHAAWWGPDRCGYTRRIERAGRYERSEALSIAGTRDGGWRVSKGNPDEIAIPEQDAIDQYAAVTAALSEQGKA